LGVTPARTTSSAPSTIGASTATSANGSTGGVSRITRSNRVRSWSSMRRIAVDPSSSAGFAGDVPAVITVS